MRSHHWRLRAAELTGRTLRATVRTTPGVAGMALVCLGLGMAWLPLGVIAAGGALLVVDWRLSTAEPQPASQSQRDHDRLSVVA